LGRVGGRGPRLFRVLARHRAPAPGGGGRTSPAQYAPHPVPNTARSLQFESADVRIALCPVGSGGVQRRTPGGVLGQFPEGYLVHSLEHDYNIFWYNCSALDEAACAALKEEIQAVMSSFDGFKLIAYPWPSQPEPVVLTHWGRILRMQSFDAGAARNFIESNRRRSPEPDAS